jgi:hypothetical protein
MWVLKIKAPIPVLSMRIHDARAIAYCGFPVSVRISGVVVADPDIGMMILRNDKNVTIK